MVESHTFQLSFSIFLETVPYWDWTGEGKNSNVAHRSFRLKSLQDIHEQDINKMSLLSERSLQQRVRTVSSFDNDASSGIFQNSGRRGVIRGPSEFWKWISSREITRKYLESKIKNGDRHMKDGEWLPWGTCWHC